MDSRTRLIGQIHGMRNRAMVCRDCGRITFSFPCTCGCSEGRKLLDEEYRACLRMWTGKGSCSQMDEEELMMAKTGFEDMGWATFWKAQKERHRKTRAKTVAIIKKEAEKTLGASWADRLDGFVDRVCHRNSIYELDDNGLRQVIGWLRRLKKREKTDSTIQKGENK